MHDNGMKNNDASYARLILDELKSSSPDFDRLCNDISEIQRLTKSGSKSHHGDKEVHLSSVEGEVLFKEKSGSCGKICIFQAKNAEMKREFAQWLHGRGAVQTMVAPVRCVISVV